MLDKIVKGFQFSYEAVQALRFSQKTRNLFDFVNFAFGFVGMHNLAKNHCFEDRDISKVYDNFPEWQQKAFKIADYSGCLSMIAYGATSTTAIAVWKWSAQQVFTPRQLERLIGKQGVIPSAKLASSVVILAYLFGLPSTLKTLYSSYTWVMSKISQTEEDDEEERDHFQCAPLRPGDVYLTFRTVSHTAQKILSTPHK